ncbi:hypothetical protein ILUMI_04591 [Ignelater luminosus]|uniref:Uncharacterized protein n=1 Tax=Ignelater luminosus TaxID=2038154 RepID=A0A8K0DC89_IGNLU|nr:hypothetical protein ILUMI_04591 [Ignelater luminosus]
MVETNPIKQIQLPGGKRPRGRPETRYLDQIMEDLEKLRITNWKEKAKNRTECARFKDTYSSTRRVPSTSTFEHLGSSQPINDVTEAIASTSASTAETSPVIKDLYMESTVSFEELLLRAVKSHSSGEKKKKMRIATGSEVITSDGVSHRVQNIQNERKIAEKQKNKRKSESKKKQAKSKKSTKRTVNETPDTLDNDAFSLRSSGSEDLAKRTTKHFAGQMSVDSGDPVIRYARKVSENECSTIFRFPQVGDKSLVDGADFVSILLQSTVGRDLAFQLCSVQYQLMVNLSDSC